MKDPRAFVEPRACIVATVVALAVFGTGVLVFAARRGHVMFTTTSWVPAHDQWPSFTHSFALVLIVGLWLSTDRMQAYRTGAALWVIAIVIEVLQHRGLHDAMNSPVWVRRWLESTFDVGDLLASTLGTAAAFATLTLLVRTVREKT